jgi:hypothetical protein
MTHGAGSSSGMWHLPLFFVFPTFALFLTFGFLESTLPAAVKLDLKICWSISGCAMFACIFQPRVFLHPLSKPRRNQVCLIDANVGPRAAEVMFRLSASDDESVRAHIADGFRLA